MERSELSTETIWRNLRSRMSDYLRTRLRSPEESEDLLQEAFLRIHQGLDRLEDDVAVDAWVYRITRNLVVDRARARSARPEGNGTIPWDELPVPLATEPEVEAWEEQRFRAELSACLLPLIRRLPLEQQQALELTEIGGLTQREAAEKVGISVSGMKSRAQRAKKRLREVIADCCQLELGRGAANFDCAPCDTKPAGPECGPAEPAIYQGRHPEPAIRTCTNRSGSRARRALPRD